MCYLGDQGFVCGAAVKEQKARRVANSAPKNIDRSVEISLQMLIFTVDSFLKVINFFGHFQEKQTLLKCDGGTDSRLI